MREFRVSSKPQTSHDFGGNAREFGHLISRGQIGELVVKKANKTKCGYSLKTLYQYENERKNEYRNEHENEHENGYKNDHENDKYNDNENENSLAPPMFISGEVIH